MFVFIKSSKIEFDVTICMHENVRFFLNNIYNKLLYVFNIHRYKIRFQNIIYLFIFEKWLSGKS